MRRRRRRRYRSGLGCDRGCGAGGGSTDTGGGVCDRVTAVCGDRGLVTRSDPASCSGAMLSFLFRVDRSFCMAKNIITCLLVDFSRNFLGCQFSVQTPTIWCRLSFAGLFSASVGLGVRFHARARLLPGKFVLSAFLRQAVIHFSVGKS